MKDELLGTFRHRLAGEAHEEVVRAEVESKQTREKTASNARKIAIRQGMDPSRIKHPERIGELESFNALRAQLRQQEAEESL